MQKNFSSNQPSHWDKTISKMKTLLMIICFPTIFALLYLVMGFMIMEFDITKWSTLSRIILVFATTFIFIPTVITIHDEL
ncbi:MAG: hypothetical protein RLZZ196_972 [Bacteroidota bacterium]|jgi:antibiotic biosynthesis monooxygenase (ABM) superfamily enzyme